MSSSNVLNCISCANILNQDHTGVRCIQDHNICADCSNNFVSSVFEEPLSSIPVKCIVCQQEIPSLVFERQLTKEQLEIYRFYIIASKLDPSERVQRCTHCQYFEIWYKSSDSNFFFCRNETCKKITCVHCYKDLILPSTHSHADYSSLETLILDRINLEEIPEDEYEDSLNAQEGVFYHLKCGKYNFFKKKFEKVQLKGQTRRCPSCKLTGRKDSACTHMTCPKCLTVWCYFCGLSEANCDKDNRGTSIYDHNIGWQYNKSRCPMYFTEIVEFDERWDEDDQVCMDRFHSYFTNQLIKKFIEKIGEKKFQKIIKQFPSIRNCGINFSEIKNESVEEDLIVRVSKDTYESMLDN